MAPEIEKLEEIVLQLRCGEVLNLDESADLLDDAIREIERLREGLRLITCEPINAEYMAQPDMFIAPPAPKPRQENLDGL